MKETALRYAARTGGAYAPPAALLELARPLRPREACPTLFRYPGPLGLREALLGARFRPAPPSARWVWLASSPGLTGSAARRFGLVAFLEPLRLDPCATPEKGLYRGVNRAVPPESVVWAPPSVLRLHLPWDRIRTADDARGRIGPAYDAERRRVAEALAAYVEELSALERAGVPAPRAPWHDVDAAERRRLLARCGIAPLWTRR